jgi:hypothetical protein
VLLAQLYRLWAAARAADLVKWVAHHKLSPLGEEGSQSSEDLGLLAAGLLEQAQARNCDGAVLALDQSKAYDRVPLTLLEELLSDSGIHPALGKPMLCMARSARRIKEVLDVIGVSKLPWCGLVPGCPMATIVEGLLMLRWRVMVAGEIPRAPLMLPPLPALGSVSDPPADEPQRRGRKPLILRCWVDDSTAGDLGTENSIVTVVKGLRAIELLAASDRLVVNRTKSAIAAAPGDFRAALSGPHPGQSELESRRSVGAMRRGSGARPPRHHCGTLGN